MKNNLQISKKFVLISISVVSFFVSIFTFFSFVYQTSVITESSQKDYFSLDQLNIVINKERVSRGIRPLALNSKLNTAAQNKASDMSEHNYFSHISPVDSKKWSDFIKDQKYEYSEAGENLANGYEAPSEMVKAWMDSPSHRENILNKDVDETGIGFVFSKLNGVPSIFVVQVFGKLDTTV